MIMVEEGGAQGQKVEAMGPGGSWRRPSAAAKEAGQACWHPVRTRCDTRATLQRTWPMTARPTRPITDFVVCALMLQRGGGS